MCSNMDIGQLIKRKSISDSRSVENILDKRLRIVYKTVPASIAVR